MSRDGSAYGGHAETAVDRPSTLWYLAEGATGGPFDLFYLIQNPGNAIADVEFAILRPPARRRSPRPTRSAPAAASRSGSNQRRHGLAQTDVSAVVTSRNGVPVIVERSMYLHHGRGAFKGGHNSAAVTAPRPSWFLAEARPAAFLDVCARGQSR